MATSIGSSAAFTSGNMKPAAGEQIDALWGQNIADNTAFLRSQKTPVFLTPLGMSVTDVWARDVTIVSSGQASLSPRGYFFRNSAHNRLVGTVRIDGTFSSAGGPTIDGTIGVYLYGDIGTFGGTTTLATSIGASFVMGSTFSFELDLTSYMSVGSWGTIVPYLFGSSHSSGANQPFSGTVGYLKAYTTWAN